MNLINKIPPSFKTLLLRGFGVSVLFLFTIVITRNFNSSEYGDYEFARLILLVFGGFALIGFDLSILSFVGELKANNRLKEFIVLYKKVFKIIFISSLILTFIFLIVPQKSLIYILGNDKAVYSITLKCFLVLIFNVVTLFNTEVFRALDKVVLSELYRNVFKFLSLYIGVVLLFFNLTDWHLFDFYLIGFVFLAITSTVQVIFFSKKLSKNRNEIGDNVSYKYDDLIRQSYSISISNIILYLLISIDVFFIRYFFSSIEVAYYAVAIKIVLLLNIVNLSFNASEATKISELYTQQKFDNLNKLILKNSKYVFLINFSAGFLILLFSGFILNIFGNEYVDSKNVLYVLIISQMIVSSMPFAQVYLNMTKKQNLFKKIMLSALIFNIIFNYLLIPLFGIMGAAISYAVTIIFWHTTSTFFAYKKDKMNLFFLKI